ncbi:Ankyrin repeat-containing domain containing protein, partial [Parasponia andersonii]
MSEPNHPQLENDKKEKEETDKRTSTEMKHRTQIAIIIAAENGIAEIVERILEKGINCSHETDKRTSTEMKHRTQTAIIIAAENGIAEIVERILEKYPVAIHDVDSNMRNILLLAAKNRHLKVYKLLKKSKKNSRDIVLRTVDKDRNCALHFAAMVDENNLKPWPIPGAALQMQWEIKWYKFVEKSMPPHFFLRANNKGETPQQIFTKNHKALVKAGGEWLTSTST